MGVDPEAAGTVIYRPRPATYRPELAGLNAANLKSVYILNDWAGHVQEPSDSA